MQLDSFHRNPINKSPLWCLLRHLEIRLSRWWTGYLDRLYENTYRLMTGKVSTVIGGYLILFALTYMAAHIVVFLFRR